MKTMSLKLERFRLRKEEIEKKHKEELAALIAAEKAELEKLVGPAIAKIAKAAEDEARKMFNADPGVLEGFTFKKRDAGKVMAKAVEEILKAMSGGNVEKSDSKPKAASGFEPVSGSQTAPDQA